MDHSLVPYDQWPAGPLVGHLKNFSFRVGCLPLQESKPSLLPQLPKPVCVDVAFAAWFEGSMAGILLNIWYFLSVKKKFSEPFAVSLGGTHLRQRPPSALTVWVRGFGSWKWYQQGCHRWREVAFLVVDTHLLLLAVAVPTSDFHGLLSLHFL